MLGKIYNTQSDVWVYRICEFLATCGIVYACWCETQIGWVFACLGFHISKTSNEICHGTLWFRNHPKCLRFWPPLYLSTIIAETKQKRNLISWSHAVCSVHWSLVIQSIKPQMFRWLVFATNFHATWVRTCSPSRPSLVSDGYDSLCVCAFSCVSNSICRSSQVKYRYPWWSIGPTE